MSIKKIAIAADHAGYDYKEILQGYLEDQGIEVRDFGTSSEASCDYPDYAHPLAQAVQAGDYPMGIVICGSGNGICMTVNKYPGIRGAMAWEDDLARLAREHNDANVLCLPSRFIDIELAKKLVDIFITTEFEGGRHQRRVDKISKGMMQ